MSWLGRCGGEVVVSAPTRSPRARSCGSRWRMTSDATGALSGWTRTRCVPRSRCRPGMARAGQLPGRTSSCLVNLGSATTAAGGCISTRTSRVLVAYQESGWPAQRPPTRATLTRIPHRLPERVRDGPARSCANPASPSGPVRADDRTPRMREPACLFPPATRGHPRPVVHVGACVADGRDPLRCDQAVSLCQGTTRRSRIISLQSLARFTRAGDTGAAELCHSAAAGARNWRPSTRRRSTPAPSVTARPTAWPPSQERSMQNPSGVSCNGLAGSCVT